jgi:hypothetical protein
MATDLAASIVARNFSADARAGDDSALLDQLVDTVVGNDGDVVRRAFRDEPGGAA